MNTYKYITKTGQEKTVQAADPNSAISAAADRDPNSGVQVVSEPSYSRSSPGTPMPTPAPTKTDTTSSMISNAQLYPRNPTALDTAKKSLETVLTTVPTAPDENAIREQKRLQAQSLVNSINAEYAEKYASAAKTGARREKRTHALSVNAGATGSDFASAAAQRTEDQNSEDVRLLDQAKNAKIQATLAAVEDRASQEYLKRREIYLKEIEGNFQKVTEFQKAQKDQARSNAVELAKNGVSLTALKSQAPDLYKQLLDESGLDTVIFDLMYNEQLPANQKRTYTYQNIGGKLYAISVDPVTGKPTTEEIASPGGNYDQFMIAPDGTPLFIDKQNGKVVEAGTGNYGKNTGSDNPTDPGGKKIVSGTYTTTENEIGQAAALLRQGGTFEGTTYNGVGKDGKVDPYFYRYLHDRWVKSGGLSDDFVKYFPPKVYVNPAAGDDILPSYLQSGVQKKVTAGSTTSGREK